MSDLQDKNRCRSDRDFVGTRLGALIRWRAIGVLCSVALVALLGSCADTDRSSNDASTIETIQIPGSNEESAGEGQAEEAEIPPRPEIAKPTAPTLDGTDEENAYSVAKYMVDSYEYMYARSDSEPWARFAGDECEYCQEIIAAVEADKESGEWAQTALTVLDSRMFQGENPKEFEVHFLIEQDEVTAFNNGGSYVTPGGRYTFVVGLNGEGAWKAIGVAISEPQTFEEGR